MYCKPKGLYAGVAVLSEARNKSHSILLSRGGGFERSEKQEPLNIT